MFQRPKQSENEDDLFNFQQQFLINRAKPSAKVIRVNTDKVIVDRDVVSLNDKINENHDQSRKVKFNIADKDGSKTKKSHYCEDDDDVTDKYDDHVTAVLSEIIEREVSNVRILAPKSTGHSFPDVVAQQSITQDSQKDGRKRKSLFAKQFAKSTQLSMPDVQNSKVEHHCELMQVEDIMERKSTINEASFSNKSRLIDGSGIGSILGQSEVETIHQRNVSFLSRMTEEEILLEQDKLMAALDPKIIAFIKAKCDQPFSTLSSSRKRSADFPSSRENRDVKMQIKEGNKTVLKSSITPQTEILEAVLEDSKMEVDHKNIQEIDCSLETKENVKIDASELPVQPNTNWLHMNKLEADKLAWLKELPKTRPLDPKTGCTARFDFSGHILNPGIEQDVKKGLHHHGDQPEVAGYSIEDLFQIIRSSFPSQRVLALQTLGNIMKLANEGVYDNYLDIPLISQLLLGGVIFILRYALDDNNENVLAAAVQALNFLLVCQSDEVAMDRIFIWHHGCENFVLEPQLSSQKDLKEEKSEKSDIELVKEDVIKGLIQMKLLPRLRYVLEVCHPDINVVVATLSILIRVSRHSLQSAVQVLNCPRLMDTIFENFLPFSWKPLDSSSPMKQAYGYPFHQAVKLMRIIATVGRNSASALISRGLDKILFHYVSMDPSQMMLNLKEACLLSTESLRTWKIFASYGLACQGYVDLYPVILQQLVFCQNLSLFGDSGNFKCERAATLISLLETLVSVASSYEEIHIEMKISKDCKPPPPINWTSISCLLEPIEICLHKWCWEFSQDEFSEDSAINLLASSINFIANYYCKFKTQKCCNVVDLIENMEIICNKSLLPLINSKKFQTCLVKLRSFSILASESLELSIRSPQNLPTMHSLLNQQQICPLIEEHTPFNLVTSLLHLLLKFTSIYQGLNHQLFEKILLAPSMQSYLTSVCHMSAASGSRAKIYFMRFENHLLYFILKLASYKVKHLSSFSLFYKVALTIVSELQSGDEDLLFDIMSTVIFNPQFLIGYGMIDDIITTELSKLQLTEKNPIAEILQVEPVKLLKEIHENFSSIKTTYLTHLSHMKDSIEYSKNRNLQLAHKVEKLIVSHRGSTLLNKEWMYLPLLQFTQLRNKSNEISDHLELPVESTTLIMTCLQFLYLMVLWHRDFTTSISPNIKYVRLTSIYFLGSNIFLDPGIQTYLQALFSELYHPDVQDKMNFKLPIPGVTAFYDFYKELLKQYEAESFGNIVFGYFILLSQQQHHSVELRKCLWSEHSSILYSIKVPINQCIVPLDRYLEPLESNIELLKLYGISLLSGSKLKECSPFLYAVAIHHLHYFLFKPDITHKVLRASLIKTLQQDKYKILADHLFLYKGIDIQCEFGLDLYSDLPQIRQNIIKQLC